MAAPKTWKKRLSSLAPAIEARIAQIDAEKADLVALLSGETGAEAGIGSGGEVPKAQATRKKGGMSDETKKKMAARMRKIWRERKAKAAASGQELAQAPEQDQTPEQTVEEVVATA